MALRTVAQAVKRGCAPQTVRTVLRIDPIKIKFVVYCRRPVVCRGVSDCCLSQYLCGAFDDQRVSTFVSLTSAGTRITGT